MKTRTDKELLIILRDNLEKRLMTGMCNVNFVLFNHGIITEEEYYILDKFLYDNNVRNYYQTTNYWWKPGSLKPRLRWLNKQIEKL